MKYGLQWKHAYLLAAVLTLFACGDLSKPLAPEGPPSRSAESTDGDELTLEGPNVIWYEHQAVLSNSTRHIIEGERTEDGGCRFAGTIILQMGEASVTELELALDPDTCRSLIERGELVEDHGEADSSETESKTASETIEAAWTSDVAATTVTTQATTTTASLHGWFSDPVGLHVNDVTNTITWTPDGECAISEGGTVSHRLTWLGQTGWSLESEIWDRGGDCDRIWSGSTAQFHNGVFCLLMDTDVWYEPNHVEGYADGSAAFDWVTRKAGTCSFMLSANRSFER